MNALTGKVSREDDSRTGLNVLGRWYSHLGGVEAIPAYCKDASQRDGASRCGIPPVFVPYSVSATLGEWPRRLPWQIRATCWPCLVSFCGFVQSKPILPYQADPSPTYQPPVASRRPMIGGWASETAGDLMSADARGGH